MAEKLNDESIKAWLGERSGWKRDGDAIRKEYVLPTFRDSIVFVNRLATIADDRDHHPDIDIRYNKVTVHLTTHDAGGLTQKDLTVAEQIDFATSSR